MSPHGPGRGPGPLGLLVGPGPGPGPLALDGRLFGNSTFQNLDIFKAPNYAIPRILAKLCKYRVSSSNDNHI